MYLHRNYKILFWQCKNFFQGYAVVGKFAVVKLNINCLIFAPELLLYSLLVVVYFYFGKNSACGSAVKIYSKKHEERTLFPLQVNVGHNLQSRPCFFGFDV